MKPTIYTLLILLTGACAAPDNVKDQAMSFARSLGMTPIGAQCMNYDSDQDGYVSCTVGLKDEHGTVSAMPIECAISLSLNNGCRMQKPVAARRY